MNKKIIGVGIIASIIATAISLFPLLMRALDNSSDFAYENYKVDATLNVDGSVDFHEEFNLDVDSGSHTYMREINYGKGKNALSDISSYMDVSTFKIKVETGDEVISASYEQPLNPDLGNKSDNIIAFEGQYDELGDKIYCQDRNSHATIIYLKNGIQKNTKYTIDYRINNVAEIFNDYTVVNWNFIPMLEANKKNVKFTLNLPENTFTLAADDKVNNESKIYYYGAGNTSASFNKEETTNTKLVAEAKRLTPHDSLELLTYFPSTIMQGEKIDEEGLPAIRKVIDDNLNTEARYARQHRIFVTSAYVASSAIIVGMILLIIFIYKRYDKELVPEFDGEYYRELPNTYPPAVMGFLYREEEVTGDDLNATLMDLIRRKYIIIDTNGATLTDKKPNYVLVYQRHLDQSGLKEYEKYLLSWFFDVVSGGNDRLSLEQLESFSKKEASAKKYVRCNDDWVKHVKKEGVNQHFYDNAATGAQKFASLALIIIICVVMNFYICFKFSAYPLCIFSAILLVMMINFLLYIKQIHRRTKQGNEDFVKWKAFKKFLEEFSQFEDYPVPGIIVWEHYLVYATAFGIADLVEKQLRTKFATLGRTAEYESSYIIRAHVYHHVSVRTTTAIATSRQTIAAAEAKRMASSSRGGGHGGFGGGSFGGGGGGHSGVR